MNKRFCPVCDGRMDTGTFCKTCKRFVKPKEYNTGFYLNESHTNTKVHSDECDYHPKTTTYDNKKTYTVNKNNSTYTRINDVKNQKAMNSMERQLATKPFVTRQEPQKKTQTKGLPGFVKLFLVFFIGIQVLGFAIPIIFAVIAPFTAAVHKDESDNVTETKIELTDEEAIEGQYVCNSDTHIDLNAAELMSSATFKGLNLLADESYSSSNNYVYRGEYEGVCRLSQVRYLVSSETNAYVIIDYDTVTDKIHNATIYSTDENHFAYLVQGIMAEFYCNSEQAVANYNTLIEEYEVVVGDTIFSRQFTENRYVVSLRYNGYLN